jgi:hypothetical protein
MILAVPLALRATKKMETPPSIHEKNYLQGPSDEVSMWKWHLAPAFMTPADSGAPRESATVMRKLAAVNEIR